MSINLQLLAETPTSERNFGIDLLRGLSILLVIIHHLALRFRLPIGPSWIGDFISERIINGLSFNGYESVFVFFVISGFLITIRTIKQYGSLEYIAWRRFYFQRMSRILPLLLCLLAVLSIMHFLQVPGYVIKKNGQSLGRTLLAALSFHLNWYEGQTGWLPGAWDVLWSLSIEEVFYTAFPILCLFLPRYVFIFSLCLLGLSLPLTHAALSSNEIWQEKAYLPGMSAIAIGVLDAILAKIWKPSRYFAHCLLAFGIIGLLSVFFYGDILGHLLHDYSLLVLCLSASFIILAVHWTKPVPHPSFNWLAHMGRLSYEIYLSHMFIVLSVCSAYRAILGENMRWTFLIYVPTIWLCVMLGMYIERMICKPVIRWLNSQVLSAR